MLKEIIQKFLFLCESDPVLIEFAQKRPITIQYNLTDLDISFFMVFKDGVVTAKMGTAPSTATLALTMDSTTFVGVMLGNIDGMSAALSGELKFKGDPLKAMALQKIQKDLNRLYQQVSMEKP
jgi:putative sterol carrier protein